MKLIRDAIYGDIILSDLAMKFVDTCEFQRLHYIKQLGFTYKVFPGATHTRFQHSIGVYHLTKKYIEKIENNHLSEFDTSKLTERQKEIVSIVGLLHDIGHGPYSHFFDEYLKTIETMLPKTHEERSSLIFRRMVTKYKIDLTNEEVEFISESFENPSNKNWYNYLVCNKIYHLDTDKLDYLVRDSYYVGYQLGFDVERILNHTIVKKNKLYISDKVRYEVEKLFLQREEMHRYVYRHGTTEKFQDFLFEKLKERKFTVNHIDGFLTWTDETLLRFILDSEVDKSQYETRGFEQMSNKKEICFRLDTQREEALRNISWLTKTVRDM